MFSCKKWLYMDCTSELQSVFQVYMHHGKSKMNLYRGYKIIKNCPDQSLILWPEQARSFFLHLISGRNLLPLLVGGTTSRTCALIEPFCQCFWLVQFFFELIFRLKGGLPKTSDPKTSDRPSHRQPRPTE